MIVRIQGVSELQNQIYYDYDTDSIPLGQGGMGIVYPGRCFRTDNETEYIPVAIKLVTNTAQDMIERAMREASIQIDHPNLLRMYGFIPNMEPDPFTHEMKPRYYVVMENLDGVSLESMLEGVFCTKTGSDIGYARELYDMGCNDRRNFTVEIMSAILKGVACLHRSGYIHRDLDPSNIMITRDREIKIIDYGVCKPVASINGADAKLTMSGSIIGKVDYAAPELLAGDVQHHNFTTDVYALGILMYRLFVGALPFEGDNSSIMKAHLSGEVPAGNISDPGIRRIVEKAVRKQQDERYQSVDGMLEDLSAVSGGLAVQDSDGKGNGAHGTWAPVLAATVAGLAAGIATAFMI